MNKHKKLTVEEIKKINYWLAGDNENHKKALDAMYGKKKNFVKTIKKKNFVKTIKENN